MSISGRTPTEQVHYYYGIPRGGRGIAALYRDHLLNSEGKLTQCSAEHYKHFAPNINNRDVTNKARIHNNKYNVAQLATRAAGREHAAHAKLLNRSFPYLLLRRLADKRGCFSSNPAFRWRRVHSAAKSQAHFSDSTASLSVHFPARSPSIH